MMKFKLPYILGSILLYSTIGTHDVQDVVISSSLPCQIRITGDFIEGSTATGVLLIVYSLVTNESDIHYHAITKQTEQSNISMNVTGLIGTEYGVSVFALENEW